MTRDEKFAEIRKLTPVWGDYLAKRLVDMPFGHENKVDFRELFTVAPRAAARIKEIRKKVKDLTPTYGAQWLAEKAVCKEYGIPFIPSASDYEKVRLPGAYYMTACDSGGTWNSAIDAQVISYALMDYLGWSLVDPDVYFEIIHHSADDVLLTCSYNTICGGRWIAFLDPATIPEELKP